MARKSISDALLGGFTGASAGTSSLGGLAQAGLIGGKAGMAVSPWAWGLLGGGALLGGISSIFGEDEQEMTPEQKRNLEISNQLGEIKVEDYKEDVRQKKRMERSRKGMASNLGAMFTGAKLGMASGASGRLE